MHSYAVSVPGAHLDFEFDSPTWGRFVKAMTMVGMAKRSTVTAFHPPAVPTDVWRELTTAASVDLRPPPDVPGGPDRADLTFVALIADLGARQAAGVCAVHVTDEQWRAFEIWQIGENTRRTLHDADVPGIAAHKLTGSTTWLVTPEECAGALAVWNETDTWAASATVQAAGPRWDAWIEILELGDAHGGFSVRAHNPAVP